MFHLRQWTCKLKPGLVILNSGYNLYYAVAVLLYLKFSNFYVVILRNNQNIEYLRKIMNYVHIYYITL